jgi:hypothetical protein
MSIRIHGGLGNLEIRGLVLGSDDLVRRQDRDPLAEDFVGFNAGIEAASEVVEAFLEDLIGFEGVCGVFVLGLKAVGDGLEHFADFLAGEFSFSTEVRCIPAIVLMPFDSAQPVERSIFSAGPDGNDSLDPRRVEERIAKIVAIKLE